MANTNFLTFEGLSAYDSKIKIWSNGANQAGFKKIIQDGDTYKLYKDPAAVSTDTPDATINVNGAGAQSKTVYITETAGTSSDPFSKRYGIYQGATGSTASPVVGEKLVDIDIPKDMVVESGSVANITFNSSDNKLYDGVTDVTELIKGTGGTATAADAGKYIKLIIANASSDIIYISAKDLVDIYVGGSTSEAVVTIDENNVIKVAIVDINAAKITYKEATEAAYELADADVPYSSEIAYYTRSGEGTEADPYVYDIDLTVTEDNYISKIGTIYIKTQDESSRESVLEALTRLDSYTPVSIAQIDSLFE